MYDSCQIEPLELKGMRWIWDLMKSCFALNLNSKVLLDPKSGHWIIPTNSFKTETIFTEKSCCYYILKPPLFSEKQVKEGKDALGEGANIVPTKNNLDEEKQQLDCSKMSQPYIFKSFLQNRTFWAHNSGNFYRRRCIS